MPAMEYRPAQRHSERRRRVKRLVVARAKATKAAQKARLAKVSQVNTAGP
jgi:hypothetical protein